MSSKVIKFQLKLSVDGKGQIVAATATTKQLQEAVKATKTDTENLNKSVYNFNQAFKAWSNIRDSFEGLDNALSALAGSYRNVEVANKRLATVMEERNSRRHLHRAKSHKSTRHRQHHQVRKRRQRSRPTQQPPQPLSPFPPRSRPHRCSQPKRYHQLQLPTRQS